MKRRSDTLECFKKFHALAEKHTFLKLRSIYVIQRANITQEQVMVLQDDNGNEYISNAFKAYLQQHGIYHQLTVAYTLQ